MSESVSPAFGNALSAAGRAVADTPSPFDMALQAQNVQKNALDIQRMQAQRQVGLLLQKHIDPRTNQLDTAGFNADLAAAGPGVALAAQEALNNAQTYRGTQIGQGGALHDLVIRSTSSIMKDPSAENINHQSDLLIQGGAPPDVVNAHRNDYLALAAKDPQAVRDRAYNDNVTTMDAAGRAKFGAGETTLEDFGGAKQPVTITQGGPGRTGTATIGPGGAPMTLTPFEQTGIVTSKDPSSNQEVKEPLNTFLTRHGYTLPGAAAAPRPTTAPAPAASPPALPPPIASGAAPDVAAKWEASTKQFNEANEAAGNYQARIFPLVQAYNIIKSGTVTTGQAADAWNQVRGALQTFGTKLGIPETGPQSIAQANSEQLVKYTQQYINAQGLSARSDQALASAITGNPGSHISTLANEQVMPAMIGMERMRQMALADFKAQKGWAPRNFSDFMNTWQNTHDPRAFIVDMLDSKQTDKIFADMDGNDAIHKAARKRFQDTLHIVEQNPGIMGQAALPH